MRRSKLAMLLVLVVGVFALATLVGCSAPAEPYVNPESVGTVSGGIPVPSSTVDAKDYSSVGQRIYMTGTNADGVTIGRESVPEAEGAMLLGGGGCAACHGSDGKGGKAAAASGSSISAPNITYGALKNAGYTDETIANAIQYCTDEAGESLDDVMPCWQMSAVDVKATIDYLKVLGK
jgi:hypothetical protein